MKALILAGGRGTRLKPLTHSSNKHALPIANKAMIMYPFLSAVNAGIKEIAIVVNETKAEIEEILGDGGNWGVKVDYLFQNEPKGLAHALSLSEDFMGDSNFVMILGDNMIQESLTPHIEYFESQKLNGMVMGIRVPIEEHKRCGMATIDENERVLRYIEKPGVVEHSDLYNPESSFAMTGFYFYDHNVFNAFKGDGQVQPSARGEYEVSSTYNWLIEHGFAVGFREVKGWWKDPGKPNDLLSANKIVLDWKEEFTMDGEVISSELKGDVEILAGSKISNCKIQGPVTIGKNVQISDSFIGAYSAIGDDSKIIGAKISNSILMGGVSVTNVDTHIKDSLIGWDVNISEEVESEEKQTNLFVGDDSVIKL